MDSLQLLLLFLCITITVSATVNLQKRIFGGERCNQRERQYHVKLIARDGTYDYLCGGSLISDRWILTSAHCWKPKWTIHAVLGVHPGPGQEVEITNIVPYKDTNKKPHDIMLLQLPKVTKIQPISLPNCEKKRDIDKVQVAGHGRFQINATGHKIPGSSPVLLCANMNVVDCSAILASIRNCFPNEPNENWFCGTGNQVDTCQGDSGGGVVYNNLIYGLISGGNDCACAFPAVFLKICPYIKWIRDTITKKT